MQVWPKKLQIDLQRNLIAKGSGSLCSSVDSSKWSPVLYQCCLILYQCPQNASRWSICLIINWFPLQTTGHLVHILDFKGLTFHTLISHCLVHQLFPDISHSFFMSHSLWGILRLSLNHCPSVSHQYGTIWIVKLFWMGFINPKFKNMEYMTSSLEIHVNCIPEFKHQCQRCPENKSETMHTWHLTYNCLTSLNLFPWHTSLLCYILVPGLFFAVPAGNSPLPAGFWILGGLFVCLFFWNGRALSFKLLSFTSISCWNTQPGKRLLNRTVSEWSAVIAFMGMKAFALIRWLKYFSRSENRILPQNTRIFKCARI